MLSNQVADLVSPRHREVVVREEEEWRKAGMYIFLTKEHFYLILLNEIRMNPK